MGYTHYWDKKNGLEGYDKALPIIKRILERYKDIIAYECDMPDTPAICNEEMIRFNGIGDDGHETFLFTNDAEEFAFCKTARKPYDVVVCECLIVLNHFTNVEISSDGMSGYYEKGMRELSVVQDPDGSWDEAMFNVEQHYDIAYEPICIEVRDQFYDWELVEKVKVSS